MHGGLAQISIALSTLMSGVTGSSHRRRRDEGAHARRADAQARLLAGLRRRRALLRLAAGADHPAGHRLHPLRHGRAGLDRPAVRRRHRARAACCGPRSPSRSRSRRGSAATRRSARRAPTRQRDRAPRPGAASGRSCSRSSCCSGLRFGVFTPSEIGAFAVIYAVAIGFFAYRMLTLRQLPRSGRRQPGRRRRGHVPARAVRHLRLRHRVRAHAGGHLRLDARHHRQPQRRDGADRRCSSCSPAPSWKARC